MSKYVYVLIFVELIISLLQHSF